MSEELESQGPVPRRAPEIPGYRVLELIGTGSAARVYQAVQVNLDRLVALKVLDPGLSIDPDFVEQFLREARTAAKLTHENIIAVHDVGKTDEFCYFAMEYVDGNSLAGLIERGGALDEKRALHIVLQIARALDHAATLELVHRDVKPSNILINRRSVAKLCDMGFASGVLDERRQKALGLTVGTPHYISPEQAQGMIDPDPRSDVYSLGATLYHAVTGFPPFTGKTPADIMAKHITDEPVAASVRVPGLSDGCGYFLSKMMEKDVERRYDPAHLVKDLESYQKGQFQVPAASFSDSSLALKAQGKSGSDGRRRRIGSRRLRRPRRK